MRSDFGIATALRTVLIAAALSLACAAPSAAADQKFVLSLDTRALVVIGNALAARPYGEVNAIIKDIEMQIAAQEKKADPGPEVKNK